MLRSGKGMLRLAVLTALLATFLIINASADTLGPGSTGERVRDLQEDLHEKGYYTAKVITDVYTSSLKSAVGVFQKANNITPKRLGYADEQTQILAASDDAILYAEYIEKKMDEQLQPGGSGAYVTKAQKQLTKLGYYSGKIDGRYRSSTVAAVKYFEKANSLVEDGIADRDTRTVLYSSNAKTRAQYEAENFLTPLSLGSKGAQVTQMQTRLALNGFYWGEPSGVYDAQTKYSVRFFQEANGFSVNGNASRTLREKINGDDSVTYEKYVADHQGIELALLSSSAKPGIKVAVLQLRLKELGYYKGLITGAYTSPVITAVRTFQIFNNMKSQYVTGKANLATRELMLKETALTYDVVCGDNTLKYGSKGAEVKKMKARLQELGYYNGTVNEVFDSFAVSALKVFQRYNGFYPSGVAYTNVLAKLYGSSAVSYTNAKVEKLIEIAESYLGVPYRSPAKPPKSFDCSTFTAYCLRKVGVYVTSEVSAQGKSKIGKVIKDIEGIKRGDILFFDTQPSKKPGHAAICLSNNGKNLKTKFIHATSSEQYRKVTVTSLYKDDWYPKRFLWAIRIWE